MIRFEGTTAFVEADTSVYTLSALKMAAYRVADRCTVVFGTPIDLRVPLEFLCTNGISESEVRDCVRAFFDEALDYGLRERLSAESAGIRNLILAHAFSRTKVVQTKVD